jgi:hypothetical protein
MQQCPEYIYVLKKEMHPSQDLTYISDHLYRPSHEIIATNKARMTLRNNKKRK